MRGMEFTGSLFLPNDPDRRQATITVLGGGLRARLEDGSQHETQWSQLTFSRGGNDGLMLFARRADGLTYCCADPGFATCIADEGGGQAREAVAPFLRQPGQRHGLLWGTALAVLVALIIGAWYAIPAMAHAAIEQMPVSVAREIGDIAFKQQDHGGPILTDPEVQAFADGLVRDLARHAERQDLEFRVAVIDSPTVNAFCLPGGQMAVYTGLLRSATSVDEVAGIVGHEMAHATRRHGVHGLLRTVGVAVALSVVLGDISGLAGQAAMTAIVNGYSRDQEHEADAEGARLAAAAGYDPRGMALFFARLAAEGGSLPGWAQWMSTHPDHAERVAAIEALAVTLPRSATRADPEAWVRCRAALERLQPISSSSASLAR